MKFEIREIDGITIAKLVWIDRGFRIAYNNQNDFRDIMSNLSIEYNSKTVVLNLEKIVYMNSVGLGIIIDTYKNFKENNGKLVLCSLLPEIENLFEITKLNKFIGIFSSELEAVKNLKEGEV